MDFDRLNQSILPLSDAAMERARYRLNDIAKPVGSLGAFEEILVQLAGVGQTEQIDITKRAVLVLCADNGVHAQGVAQTPMEITATMAKLIAAGRSSVCVMAKYAHADVIAVDIGVRRRLSCPGMLDYHIADGTADMTEAPAMTRDQATRAITAGMALARDAREQGYRLLLTGEMGIGNTTTSSAVASVLLHLPVPDVTGRGAGLSDAGLMRKLAAIERAIAVNKPDPDDAFDVLRKLGGYDIAGLCGVFLGGAQCGVPVVVDGFISAVAALVAVRLCPAARAYMIASHVSAEPAGEAVLSALSLSPVLHAGMRLGEGTGAVALLPLLDMALSVYETLPTFADIGM